MTPRTQPRTYEGRALPRPDDDLEDQGLAFDVGTLLSRRRALGLLGLGAAGTLAACAPAGTGSTAASSSATSEAAAATSAATGDDAAATSTADLTEIPDETAGPYPGDGSNGADVLEQSGVVRSDLTSSFGDSAGGTATGIPMTLELTLLDIAAGGGPMTGAAVYVWHCTDSGLYSMYSSGVEDENFLRGVQVTDDAGVVTFTSIVPGCYAGRWPHIHVEVYPDEASIVDSTTNICTSQVALPQGMSEAVYATSGYDGSTENLGQLTLASDNVFGDDGGVHQLATVSGDTDAGYVVRLTVPIDTTTAASSGEMGGGGGQGGEPPEPPAGG
ncbi:3,4-dioxygenase subunit beta [Serinicoccus sp. CUA-874]|uniref:dioxygenase family protein n=1 Tax=Serinicoccus sp. CUA-874 TaxID=1517939 RepID=UPI0009690EFE|nr:3,4-dioxygenase subunit beta [Serinicoccus sp. CUA-874]OLT17864.1 3,4-dioxygenase subunit beta [Serinicoccus sp. CUA-874]